MNHFCAAVWRLRKSCGFCDSKYLIATLNSRRQHVDDVIQLIDIRF